MRTNNKVMAIFLLAGIMALGFVMAAEFCEDSDADDITVVSTYEELRSAVTSTASGESKTIQLQEGVTIEKTGDWFGINGGRNIVLDMNGGSITGPYLLFYVLNGSLEITGSGNIEATGASSELNYPVIQITGYSSTTYNPTTFVLGSDVYVEGYNGILINGQDKTSYGVDIEINGTIKAESIGLTINGNVTNNTGSPVINLSESCVISAGVPVYLAGYGKTTIQGGFYTGVDSALEIRAGELHIGGGYFSATASPISIEGNNNGTTTSGAAIAVAQHTTKLPIKVDITGGMFNACAALYQSNPQGNAQDMMDTVITTISGGTFLCEGFDDGVSVYRLDSEVDDSTIKSGTISISAGFFETDPSAYLADGCVSKLISGVYVVGAAGDDDTVITEETETSADGSQVTTEAVISVDSTGKVSGATITITTDKGSESTAMIDSSGNTTLVSSTSGIVQLSDAAIETIILLSKSASGSDNISIDVITVGTTVSLGSEVTAAVSDGFLNLSITMNRGTSAQATITLNSGSLEADSTYTLSVAGNASKASALTSAGLTGLTPFDLGLYVNDEEAELSGSVTVSIPVQEKYDNMRLYCLDEKKFYSVSYRNGSVTATLPHFSTWAIVYDKPVVVTEDDDNILFILEQQRKAQEAASSQTTSEDNSGEEAAVIIAAAAVAGAMLACAFFAFRKI